MRDECAGLFVACASEQRFENQLVAVGPECLVVNPHAQFIRGACVFKLQEPSLIRPIAPATVALPLMLHGKDNSHEFVPSDEFIRGSTD